MHSIFESHPIDKGHSWTIITKFGHILKKAEKKYGNRDNNYTILGIELTSKNNPQIWFPNYGKSIYIVIQITENCLNDMDRAVFQVAHETIHCLSPIKENKVSVLEEGLATLFSIEYCKKNNHGKSWSAKKAEYINAQILVKELFKIDKNIIKKLRAVQPSFSKISKQLILKTNPEIPELLAKELTKPFKINSGLNLT